MNGEKIIMVMPHSVVTAADGETAYIRFSHYPDGRDMTAGRFACQPYVGFAVKEQEPTAASDLSWMKIMGRAYDGKSGFTAKQIVNFVRALGKCAYIDKGDCAVTEEVRRLLLAEEEYTIIFDIEGTQTVVTARGGDVPVYPGGTPQKDATDQYEYAFSGWEPPIAPADHDTTYYAEFSESVREYPISWLDEDGTILRVDTVPYGSMPSYEDVPTKEPDEQYYYVFSVWSPSVSLVSGAATYTASYNAILRPYAVKWVSEGDVLKTELVYYGQVPQYSGETPEKEPSGKEKYTFSHWEPEVSAVVGDATYTAVFTAAPNCMSLSVEYDNTTPVSASTALSDLDVIVRAMYADGTYTEPLQHGSDYGMVITAPNPGVWTTDADNTVLVSGYGAYAGLSATFTVTVTGKVTVSISTTKCTEINGNSSVEVPVGETAKIEFVPFDGYEFEDGDLLYVMMPTSPALKAVWSINDSGNAVLEISPTDSNVGTVYSVHLTATAVEGSGDDDGLLHLTPDDGVNTSEIGLQNANVLQEALNRGGTVTLYPGEYPLEPLIVTVDSCTLDMNGSTLTSTVEKYSGGGLINLRGNDPVIKNGELAGLYDEYNVDESQADETGVIWERESLVSLTPSGYSNAVVENMKLHNCWGYAICERGTPYRATWKAKIDDDNMDCDTTANNVGGKITATGSGYEYVTRDFSLTDIPSAFRQNLQPPYKRICAQFAGYFRIISDKKIEYTFKDADGSVVEDTITEVPGMPVEIPEGAETASIKAFWNEGNETWKHWYDSDGNTVYRNIGLWFMDDFVGGLTVKGCHTYNNYSLGMVGGGNGKTTAQNCVSWGNGRIYDGETYKDRTTVGFIDIEDTPSPYVELDHCYSHDENHFALLGAYNAKVTNCSGKDVIIYGGFGADISTDADATVTSETGEAVEAGVYPGAGGCGTSAASVTTPVTVTNCKMGNFTSGVHAPENVVGTNCTIEQLDRGARGESDNFNGFKTGKNKFFYEFSVANVKLGDVTGIWEAEIYIHFDGTEMPSCGYIFSKLATEVGTDLTIQVSCDDGSTLAYPIKTTGNCYGLHSNVAIIPSYDTDGIANSTFATTFPIPYSNVTPKGKYENCTFDTSEECFIKLPATKNITTGSFTFNKCTIKNSQNYLLGTADTTNSYGWHDGFTLYVNNSEIEDKTKLCKTSKNGAATVTIDGVEQ